MTFHTVGKMNFGSTEGMKVGNRQIFFMAGLRSYPAQATLNWLSLETHECILRGKLFLTGLP